MIMSLSYECNSGFRCQMGQCVVVARRDQLVGWGWMSASSTKRGSHHSLTRGQVEWTWTSARQE